MEQLCLKTMDMGFWNNLKKQNIIILIIPAMGAHLVFLLAR